MESIVTDLVKRGPALGIFMILATQRPDAKSIPTGISANAVLRFCLKVQGQIENDMVLGTSQYKAGIRATLFGFDEKGLLYFGGEGMRPRIVRSQYIDGPMAKVIVARARVMRESAGRITGYALGEDGDQETRSLAADVLMVFGTDDKLWLRDHRRAAARLDSLGLRRHHDRRRGGHAPRARRGGQEGPRARQGPRAGCERAAVAAAVDPAHV